MGHITDWSHEQDHAARRAIQEQRHMLVDGLGTVVTLVIILGLAGVFFSAMKQAEFSTPTHQIEISTPLEMR